DCKAPKVQVQAAHTAVKNSNVESNAEENQEELIDNEEVPPEMEEPEGDDDAESVHIDGDEYVTVNVYDNEYYARDDKEEHLFALTEHQGDKRVHMQCVTLQKAADKLQQPQYTPQEKECLVTYVEVNGHPAWTLWDSRSTTTGITPQFAHVKGKVKTQGLSDNDIPQLRQAWQQEFADIVNGTKEELPPWRKEQLHEKTNQYINAKWWEPWPATQAALLLCISKKDGTLWTVLDARQHNDNTIKDVTPLLDQEVIRKDVMKARYRSKIDLTDAYEQ
ncbi:hypothetical protein C0995_011405, partial [Termitomyces sp. Mi166